MYDSLPATGTSGMMEQEIAGTSFSQARERKKSRPKRRATLSDKR
jgi:hypothetical protein